MPGNISKPNYNKGWLFRCFTCHKCFISYGVQHPAGYVINDACQSLLKKTGSGCKTFLCLCGFWARNVQSLQEQVRFVPRLCTLPNCVYLTSMYAFGDTRNWMLLGSNIYIYIYIHHIYHIYHSSSFPIQAPDPGMNAAHSLVRVLWMMATGFLSSLGHTFLQGPRSVFWIP